MEELRRHPRFLGECHFNHRLLRQNAGHSHTASWSRSLERSRHGNRSKSCFTNFFVTKLNLAYYWQFRAELRTESRSNGTVGDPCLPAVNVSRPAYYQARVQGDPAKHRNHCSQPGSTRCPGPSFVRSTYRLYARAHLLSFICHSLSFVSTRMMALRYG